MNFHKLKVAIVQILTAGVLIVTALVIYIAHAEHNAKQKAQAFCDALHIGAPTAGLIEQAIEAGADKKMTQWFNRPDEPDWLPVTFTGIPPLSRHICAVEAVKGKLTGAEYHYLD